MRNDTFVAKGDSSYHYADNHLDASLFGSGDLRRALVNFQIVSLPHGSTVNSAKLQMYLWQNSSGGAFTTLCQPVIGSWDTTPPGPTPSATARSALALAATTSRLPQDQTITRLGT